MYREAERRNAMSEEMYPADKYGGSGPQNYQRYFVPSIGAPVAEDLIQAAALRRGERVLDVACGTGVVTRLAAERVGERGFVAGLDVNPGMLDVARTSTPAGTSIKWHEASAEQMPFSDEAFDVVLCQMGLQFIPDKLAALREMRRVLTAQGRLLLTLPGPIPAPMAAMEQALVRNVSPESGAVAQIVFALHDADELRELASAAGLREVDLRSAVKQLRLPPPADFFWQYVHSTPLSAVVADLGDERRAALERDVCGRWQPFVADGALRLEVRMTTLVARK
jgi:ubiquinone/menaquinone biosynthesis C-methylase UbiE